MRAVFFFALSAAVAALLAASGLAQPKHDFSAAALTAAPTTGWPTNGGNLYNQRYSPLTAINRDERRAAQRRVARSIARFGHGAAVLGLRAQPIVYDGVAYVSTGANDVFALSIETGEILWQYAAHLDPNDQLRLLRLEQQGRRDQRRQGFHRPARRPARGARSRAPARSRGRFRPSGGRTTSRSRPRPLYVNGMVIIGFAGADRGTRGRVKAYDAKDGRLVWTFYTIPGPGEPGHETWPKDNDAWKYGGACDVADAGGRSRARSRVFLDRQCGPRLQRRRARRRQPLRRVDRGRSRPRPENIAGTSSRCITTSGITTRSIPSS